MHLGFSQFAMMIGVVSTSTRVRLCCGWRQRCLMPWFGDGFGSCLDIGAVRTPHQLQPCCAHACEATCSFRQTPTPLLAIAHPRLYPAGAELLAAPTTSSTPQRRPGTGWRSTPPRTPVLAFDVKAACVTTSVLCRSGAYSDAGSTPTARPLHHCRMKQASVYSRPRDMASS
jgi:hypothetical protein